jgi:exopolyphosphatase / guanosine-5'-triphosphate,3'-diphosphate pyrophosphatase
LLVILQGECFNSLVPRITVIDTGSNAIRLAIAKDKGNSFELLYKHREPIRLGTDVFNEGRISSDLLGQTVTAFKKFKKLAEEYEAPTIRAIATSALRDAKNQKEVVKKIFEETGISLDVISGDRESELVFKAICHAMDLKKDNALLIDIGGGSVELVAVEKGKIVKSRSFPMGTVRLLAALKESPADYENQIKALQPKITDALHYIQDLKMNFNFCVGIGGNIERMAKVNPILSDKALPKQLHLNDLIRMYDVLSPCSVEKRKRLFDLKSDQADVIIPAIVMCIYFMQTAVSLDLHVPNVGIKDGVILEELKLIR